MVLRAPPDRLTMSLAEHAPTSSRLTFRRMRPDDLDDMARLLGDPTVMTHYPRPKTRAEALDWIRWNEANYARDGFGLWILHDGTGAFVGDCGLTWQQVDGEEHLEVGYHLLPAFQGRGLATEAAAACRDLARARGIGRLIAITRPDNVPSQRVAERIGLTFERETVSHGGVRVHVHGAAL
ncbi:GNAT family N-acetyltransferase [Nocardioides sp. LHG3406-4]|uniref:GNAT family N-acetyltransferase n=1 Tax=Nocardioides sp. LHG3406-4 TaxID=2804575 RepID=UPI003CFA8BBA